MIPYPVTANVNDKVSEVMYLMKEKKVSHLLVEDDDYQLVGVISNVDLLAKTQTLLNVSFDSEASKTNLYTATAKDIMTPDPVTISPKHSIETASVIMLEKSFHCLPVVDNGKTVGILTYTDLLLGFIGRTYEFPL